MLFMWLGPPQRLISPAGSTPLIFVKHNSLLTSHYAEHSSNREHPQGQRSEVDLRMHSSKKKKKKGLNGKWMCGASFMGESFIRTSMWDGMGHVLKRQTKAVYDLLPMGSGNSRSWECAFILEILCEKNCLLRFDSWGVVVPCVDSNKIELVFMRQEDLLWTWDSTVNNGRGAPAVSLAIVWSQGVIFNWCWIECEGWIVWRFLIWIWRTVLGKVAPKLRI